MPSEEALKITTARSHHPSDDPGSDNPLTSEDIGHILGTIQNPNAADFGRYYLLEENIDLSERLYKQIQAFPKVKNWYEPRDDFILDLCRLALREVLSEVKSRCWTCKGSKGMRLTKAHVQAMNQDPRRVQKFREGQLIDCLKCAGTGRRGVSDHDRADFLGIPMQSFKDPWKPRYGVVMGKVNDWHTVLTAAIGPGLERKILQKLGEA